MPSQLPSLRHIAMPDIAQFSTLPLLKIKTDGDVRIWRTTRGYQDYGLFLRRLNESVVGYFLPWSSPSISEVILRHTFTLIVSHIILACQTTRSIVTLLDTLDGWIDDIPPLSTPQRFGNIAFRTWGKRLEEVSCYLHVRIYSVLTLYSKRTPFYLHYCRRNTQQLYPI